MSDDFVNIKVRWCDTKQEGHRLNNSGTKQEWQLKFVLAESEEHLLDIKCVKRFFITKHRLAMTFYLWNDVLLYLNENCLDVFYFLLKSNRFKFEGNAMNDPDIIEVYISKETFI